jgi:hypothetical protein
MRKRVSLAHLLFAEKPVPIPANPQNSSVRPVEVATSTVACERPGIRRLELPVT